jgi:hypothetical protein
LLRRRGEHHQGICENRECAAEVNFPKPCDIETESVPEFDLRYNVSVTLTLGKPGRTRQLVEEAEALIPPDWVAGTRTRQPNSTARARQQSRTETSARP